MPLVKPIYCAVVKYLDWPIFGESGEREKFRCGWKAARQAEAAARDTLVRNVTRANAAGASEYALAAAAGVSRQTIRAWLGKS